MSNNNNDTILILKDSVELTLITMIGIVNLLNMDIHKLMIDNKVLKVFLTNLYEIFPKLMRSLIVLGECVHSKAYVCLSHLLLLKLFMILQ